MLPIAVLPIAGMLLRLGQPDLLDIAFVAAAGDAIFSHLGLLFAIGVAVGLARENHGAAGLAGRGLLPGRDRRARRRCSRSRRTRPRASPTRPRATSPPPRGKTKQLDKLSVPAGILSGIAAGMLYNRFSDIKLPDYLAFFGGRRFVPIAAGLVGLVLALAVRPRLSVSRKRHRPAQPRGWSRRAVRACSSTACSTGC